MYFFYLSKIIRLFVYIRYLYGSYIAYSFLRWILQKKNSGFLSCISNIFKPFPQIDDKYTHSEIIDDFVVIK